MRTELNHLTDKELTTFVAHKKDATNLEVELMQRVDNLLELVEDLEEQLTASLDSAHEPAEVTA